MLQLWLGLCRAVELCQIEQKHKMTFEASDFRLVRQGTKLVAHYLPLSRLSCLLTVLCVSMVEAVCET
jgi:hypothetical protein